MANIKPMDDSSDKWVRRAGVAAEDYRKGIENPRKSWSSASVSAEGNYKQGVTTAAAAGRYGKGIKAAGDAKWKENAMSKGPGRFAEGVSLAKDQWSKGFAPYHSAIASLTLPPRGPKGDPKNLHRVAAVANALRAVYEKRS